MNHPIHEIFHDDDIWNGIAPAESDEVPGWNDHDFRPVFHENSALILEIGSWLGRSAINLARTFTNARIACIDTWTGAPEMWAWKKDESRYGALKRRNGMPTIYWDFMANIVRSGVQAQITPIPLPSGMALRILRENGIRPDGIYVDGDHSCEGCTEDIQNALKLHPRVLAGDDYGCGSWPGVTSAVNRLLPNARKNSAGLWWDTP